MKLWKKISIIAGLITGLFIVSICICFKENIELRIAEPTNNEFTNWQDLKPGQKGFGLTVFKGDIPERFYVTFDETAPHPMSDQKKVILVRMGPPLEESAVLAGMSGSPVYFRDNKNKGTMCVPYTDWCLFRKWKLAGAIAFGYGSMARPSDGSLGGVTPIQLMLEQKKHAGIENVSLNTKKALKNWHNNLLNNQDIIGELSKPIVIGTYKKYQIKLLGPRIELLKSPGNTGGNNHNLAIPKPGEAFSMVLVGGDYQMAATCTITYVDNDNFWGCGHPFFGQGDIVLPTYRSAIATSFKSQDSGWKMLKEFNEPIGYINYDYLFAVQGPLKMPPPNTFIDFGVSVTIGNTEKANLNLKVINHDQLAARLIGGITDSFMENLWPGYEPATAKSKTIVNFSDRPSIIFQESLIVSQPSVSFWSEYVDRDKQLPGSAPAVKLSQLMNNKWNFHIRSIYTTTHIEPGENFFKLDSFALLNSSGALTDEINLGDTVTLVLGVKNSDPKQQYAIAIPITLPKTLELEKTPMLMQFVSADIFVESGNNYVERDESKILNHPPDTAEEFIKNLLVNERDHDTVYIQLVLPPAKKKEEQTTWPKLNKKWGVVDTLAFLRKSKPIRQPVIIQELVSPEQKYILDIETSVPIKINLPPVKPIKINPPPVKKSIKRKLKQPKPKIPQ